MSSNSTLISLALLKVTIDQKGDYLDYWLPFVSQILFDNKDSIVTDLLIKEKLDDKFGLSAPISICTTLLKRCTDKKLIHRENHQYRVSSSIKNPCLDRKKAEAARHISNIINGLSDFSKNEKIYMSPSESELALMNFCSEFQIQYLNINNGNAVPFNTLASNSNFIRLVTLCSFVISIRPIMHDKKKA